MAFHFFQNDSHCSFWKTTTFNYKNIGKPLILKLNLLEKQCFNLKLYWKTTFGEFYVS